MNEETHSSVPTTFKVIAGVAVLWNVMGLIAYVGEMMISPEILAELPEAQASLRFNVPIWSTAAFAIAVHAGTLGSIALLIRKAWAAPVLMLSLAGVVVQQVHLYFMSDAVDVLGMAGMILPAVVLIVAIFLVWYSRSAIDKGWLS